MSIPVIVSLVVLAILLLWGVFTYNGLIAQRNEVKNAFAQIDVQLKRRYDLIPNLVETAKKYLSHERETLEAVIAARGQAHNARGALSQNPANPEAIKQLNTAELGLHASLGKLLALNERYPELKADHTLRELNEELTSTENRIGFARQAYNDSIMVFNNAALSFPDLIIGKLFGFTELPMLESTQSEAERQAPKVSF